MLWWMKQKQVVDGARTMITRLDDQTTKRHQTTRHMVSDIRVGLMNKLRNDTTYEWAWKTSYETTRHTSGLGKQATKGKKVRMRLKNKLRTSAKQVQASANKCGHGMARCGEANRGLQNSLLATLISERPVLWFVHTMIFVMTHDDTLYSDTLCLCC